MSVPASFPLQGVSLEFGGGAAALGTAEVVRMCVTHSRAQVSPWVVAGVSACGAAVAAAVQAQTFRISTACDTLFKVPLARRDDEHMNVARHYIQPFLRYAAQSVTVRA